MKPRDRYRWIREYIKTVMGGTVDILDSEFVLDYIDQTGARAGYCVFGAPKCPQLGRDLGEMFRIGMLKRQATGLPPGDSDMGFPKWVYTYRLSGRWKNEVCPSDGRLSNTWINNES